MITRTSFPTRRPMTARLSASRKGIVPGGTLDRERRRCRCARVQGIWPRPSRSKIHNRHGWGDKFDWLISGSMAESPVPMANGCASIAGARVNTESAMQRRPCCLSVSGVQPTDGRGAWRVFRESRADLRSRPKSMASRSSTITPIIRGGSGDPGGGPLPLSGRRIVAAFQPHTYSRTRALAPVNSPPRWLLADLADRARYLPGSRNRLTRRFCRKRSSVSRSSRSPCIACGKPSDAATLLAELARPGDVILTLAPVISPGRAPARRSHRPTHPDEGMGPSKRSNSGPRTAATRQSNETAPSRASRPGGSADRPIT